MAPMVDQVVITRRNGRLWKAEALDLEGNAICELPLLGVEYAGYVRDPGDAKLLMWGPRVQIVDRAESD